MIRPLLLLMIAGCAQPPTHKVALELEEEGGACCPTTPALCGQCASPPSATAQSQSLEFETASDEDKKNKKSCGDASDGSKDYLKGCTPLYGTDQNSANWLACWVSKYCAGGACVDWAVSTCPISTDDQKQIGDDCKNKSDNKTARVVCGARAVHKKLYDLNHKDGATEDTYVCRHHAICLAQVSAYLGAGTASRYSGVGGWTPGNGHSWVQFDVGDGKTVYADAYNPHNEADPEKAGYFYRCPD